MYTVKQLTEYLNVSDTTIRTTWGNEFAKYLSEHATPPKGHERRYTEGDLAVFRTVAILRNRGVDYADIHSTLSAGERLEPKEGEFSSTLGETPENDAPAAVTTQAFTQALQSYENRVTRLEKRLEETTDRLIDAEARAAASEARAQLLQKQVDQAQADQPDHAPAAADLPWYKRLFSR